MVFDCFGVGAPFGVWKTRFLGQCLPVTPPNGKHPVWTQPMRNLDTVRRSNKEQATLLADTALLLWVLELYESSAATRDSLFTGSMFDLIGVQMGNIMGELRLKGGNIPNGLPIADLQFVLQLDLQFDYSPRLKTMIKD